MKKIVIVGVFSCALTTISSFAGTISVNNVTGGAAVIQTQYTLTVMKKGQACTYAMQGCYASLGEMRTVILRQSGISPVFYKHQTNYPDNIASVVNSGPVRAESASIQIGNVTYNCNAVTVVPGGSQASHVNLTYMLYNKSHTCALTVSTT